MTVINPPGYLHNVSTHTAQVDRLAAIASGMAPDGAGLTWRGGVRGLNDLKVVQRAAGANMSVDVGAGLAFVKGTSNSFQGLYSVPNDGAVNVTITAAHATLGRRDLIIARVQDSFYAGSLNTATIEVVTGTAASSPVDPAVPASSLVLARVTVNAAVTSITNANITDQRTWSAALGGVITCLSSARPSATLAAGMEIYESDTGGRYISDGTNWINTGTGHDAWQTYTPVWTTTGTAPSVGNGTLTGKFKQIGKTVHFALGLKFGSTSGPGTGTWSFTLPVSARQFFAFAEGNGIPGAGHILDFGVKNYPQAFANPLDTAAKFQALADNHAGIVGGITNTFPFSWGANDVYSFAGTYEAA